MLTTVTTATTTTTATTVASATTASGIGIVAASSSLGHAAEFGAISIAILIALLIAKELLSASENEKAQLIGRFTSIAINPLMFTFVLVVAIKVLEIL